MATHMDEKTDPKVYSILEHARVTGKRVRLWLGAPETGQVWLEEYDVLGYVGRSGGTKKVFLLIPNKRSFGGGAISTDSIMRITIDKKEVYRHTNYKEQEFYIHESTPELKRKQLYYTVAVNGKEHANFLSREQAERWVSFMRGYRNSK